MEKKYNDSKEPKFMRALHTVDKGIVDHLSPAIIMGILSLEAAVVLSVHNHKAKTVAPKQPVALEQTATVETNEAMQALQIVDDVKAMVAQNAAQGVATDLNQINATVLAGLSEATQTPLNELTQIDNQTLLAALDQLSVNLNSELLAEMSQNQTPAPEMER